MIEKGIQIFPYDRTSMVPQVRFKQAIEDAKKTIKMCFYDMKDDMKNGEFTKSILSAAERGVIVEIVLDGLGIYMYKRKDIATSEDAIFRALIHPKIKIFWGPDRIMFTHAKYVLIDDSYALVSTGNINCHPSVDFIAEISEPNYIGCLIDMHFHSLGVKPYLLPPTADEIGFIISNGSIKDPGKQVRPWGNYLRNAKDLLNSCEESVWLYQLEYERVFGIHDNLLKIAKKGCEVKMIISLYPKTVNSLISLHELIDAGVLIRNIPDPELEVHAKVIIVDQKKVICGSTNLTVSSVFNNLELNFSTDVADVVGTLTDLFVSDFRNSIPFVGILEPEDLPRFPAGIIDLDEFEKTIEQW